MKFTSFADIKWSFQSEACSLSVTANLSKSSQYFTSSYRIRNFVFFILSQVQSELSSGILNAFPSQEKPSLDIPMISSTVSSSEAISTESTSRETFTRRFVPSSKTTTLKPKVDRNKSLFDNVPLADDLAGLLPANYKPRGSTSSKTTMTTTTTSSPNPTTEKANRKDGKTKTPSGISKFKVKFDDVNSFLPPDYKPPPSVRYLT
jgi:hypothetical protein